MPSRASSLKTKQVFLEPERHKKEKKKREKEKRGQTQVSAPKSASGIAICRLPPAHYCRKG